MGHMPNGQLSIDSILAEGNIRHFWNGDENTKQLVASVRSVGVVEPVIVVPLGRRSNGHAYRLIAGFRRYAAACEAGLDRIPAVVRRGMTAAQIIEVQLVENLHRLDMNPIEEAVAVKNLAAAAGIRQDEVARRIGRSGAWVSLRLGLLKLPEDVQEKLATGKLSVAHGNALVNYSDREPELIRRAVTMTEQLAMGPWRTSLSRIMGEIPSCFGRSGVPERPRKKRSRCICPCDHCVSGRAMAPHPGE